METSNSTSGFTSEASLTSTFPHTPPYTPHQKKRGFESNDSPSSVRSESVKPTETSSPAKKAAKRHINDSVQVEELTEADPGYFAEVDVIYPHELEEVESDTDDDSGGSGEGVSDNGITDQFARLGCENNSEMEFEKQRREKHQRRRMNARVFKRSHSQSAKSDTEITDPDAMADHDLFQSARRLRRRVWGPSDGNAVSNEAPRSSPNRTGLTPAAEIHERPLRVGDSDNAGTGHSARNAMDLDDST